MSNRKTKKAHSGDWLMQCDSQYWTGNQQLINFEACYLNEFNWFYREGSVKERVSYNFVKSGKWDASGEGKLTISRGNYRYQEFSNGIYNCFAFRMIFGVNGETGQPNHQLIGFYCKKFDEINVQTIGSILKAIGYKHDRFGFDAQRPVATSTINKTKKSSSIQKASPPRVRSKTTSKSAGEAVSCFNNPKLCAKKKNEKSDSKKSDPKLTGNIQTRLRRLKSIYDEGLITKEDYDQKKAKILSDL